jgi:hypothetical protein
MTGSWPPQDFPQLNILNHVETSPKTQRYNCVAWAAGNDTRWWWPDPLRTSYWPPNVPREETMDAFILAFGTLGYAPCADGTREPGFDKIAIYATYAMGIHFPTHVARQMPTGQWTSKLGNCEDVAHSNTDVLTGPRYGAAVQFMKRPAPIAPH